MTTRVISVLIVLWPCVLLLLAILILVLASMKGCRVSARGPEVCMVFGRDIGEQLYPLWAMGYYFVLSLLWVPAGLLLLGVLRVLGLLKERG